ncbi:MAG TPA: universal stress protein [Puia sp.]
MNSYKTILIPVDLSINTGLAVKKALEFADPDISFVHLLHVTRYKPIPNDEQDDDFSADPSENGVNKYYVTEMKLVEWEKRLRESSPGIHFQTHLVPGRRIQREIIRVASVLKPDLIIIAKSSGLRWFSFLSTIKTGILAHRTNSAVLTVKPGSENSSIKSVVIPVRSFIPKRKFNSLVPLLKEKNITIYLLSLLDSGNKFDYSSASFAFIETYRLLKDMGNCQIVHKLISGHNMAKSILQYAQSVHADVLMVNPEENKISKLLDIDIIDRISRSSTLQILAINPAVKL